LNVQINSVTSELTEKSKLGPALAECTSNLSNFRDQINVLKSKVSDYEITNQGLLKNINSKDTQIDILKADMARVNSDFANLAKLLGAEKAKLEECSKKLTDNGKSIEKFVGDNDRQAILINNLNIENAKIVDSWNKAQVTLKEGQVCQNELFSVRKELEGCQSKSREFESFRRILETDNMGKAEQIKLLRENLNAIKSEIDKLKIEQNSFLTTASTHKKDLLNKISILEIERLQLQAKISSMNEETGNMRIQLAKLTTQLSICDDKDKKITELTNSFNDIANRFNQLKIDYNNLQSVVNEKNQLVAQLEMRGAQHRDSVTQCQNDKERINRDLLSAVGDLNTLKVARDSLKSTISDYSDQISSLTNRLRTSDSQLSDCNIKNASLTQKVISLEESERNCQDLSRELRNVKDTVELLKNNLSDCGKARSSNDITIGECRGKLTEVNIQISNCQNDLGKAISSYKSDFEKVQNDLKNLNVALKEGKDREDQCKANLQQCSSSNGSFADQLKAYLVQQNECRITGDNLITCRTDLQNEKFSGREKDKTIAGLQAQVSDLKLNIGNFQNQVNNFQIVINKFESGNIECAARIEALRQENVACSSARKDDLNSWNAQIQAIKLQLNDSDKNLMNCRSEVLNLQKNFQHLNSDFESCKESNRINNDKLSKLEKKVIILEGVQADLEKNINIVKSLQKDNDDLRQFKIMYNDAQIQITNLNVNYSAQIGKCNSEKSALQSSLDVINEKITSVENQLKLANQKIVLLSSRNQDLNEDKRSLMYKLSQSEFALKELQNRSSSFQTCTLEIAKIKEQVKVLQAARDLLEREKSSLVTKLQSTTSQLTQITSKFKYLITKLEYMNVIKRDQITNVQNFINSSSDVDINNQVYVGSSFTSDLN
jgi:nucleoprotein TPR